MTPSAILGGFSAICSVLTGESWFHFAISLLLSSLPMRSMLILDFYDCMLGKACFIFKTKNTLCIGWLNFNQPSKLNKQINPSKWFSNIYLQIFISIIKLRIPLFSLLFIWKSGWHFLLLILWFWLWFGLGPALLLSFFLFPILLLFLNFLSLSLGLSAFPPFFGIFAPFPLFFLLFHFVFFFATI